MKALTLKQWKYKKMKEKEAKGLAKFYDITGVDYEIEIVKRLDGVEYPVVKKLEKSA